MGAWCRVLVSCRNRGLRDGDTLVISTGRRDTPVPVSFFGGLGGFSGFSFSVWDDAVAFGSFARPGVIIIMLAVRSPADSLSS